ncbi:hypothetical protein BDV93DRAFT_562275 [Ceratobasidium sp. AG-I]|nr:hypothetical protein BDV93DRAFT_562275 [Ceratobasidium sp. AG-I]
MQANNDTDFTDGAMELEMVNGGAPPRYDCVWVTVAWLLDLTMRELQNKTAGLRRPRDGGPGGMKPEDIVTMLTTHHVVHQAAFRYHWLDASFTFGQALQRAKELAEELGVTKAGFAYSRPKADGHCVLYLKPAQSEADKWVCYDAQKAEGFQGMNGHEEHPLDGALRPEAIGLGMDGMLACAPYLVFAIKSVGGMEIEK